MKLSVTNLIVILSGLLLLVISASIPIARFAQTPPGQVYGGHQFYTDDYNAYAQTIRQGLDGRWTVVDKFTSEPHSSSLFRIFYLTLGKTIGFFTTPFAKLANIEPTALVYHLSRLLLAIVLLVVIWQFLGQILFQGPPIVKLSAWLLILFANVWPKDLSAIFSLPWDWQMLLPHFREPEVTTRFFSQPHYLAGFLIAFLILTALIKHLDRQIPTKTISAVFVLAFLGSWIEPTPIVLLSATLWIYAGLLLLVFYDRSQLWQKVKSVAITALAVTLSLIPATLYYQTLRQQPPWSNNSLYESLQDFYLSPVQLLPIFGLPLIFGLIGLALSLKEKKGLIRWEVTLLLFSLIIAFFLLFYPLAPLAMINRLRIFRQPVFVIFDIFAAVAIYQLGQKVARLKFFPSVTRLSVSQIFITIMLILIILPGLPSAMAFFRDQLLEYRKIPSFAYPPVENLQAFKWLETNTPRDSAVAALYEAGSLIPQFSGNTSYLGNVVETINFSQKTDLLGRFYSGQISPDQAKQFLTDGRINYLYWGFQERSLGGNPLSYNFVKEVYSNPKVTIFQVSSSN